MVKPKTKLYFDKFSTVVAKKTGSSTAFVAALVTVLVWTSTGPIFHFSDTWQLVINTGTTIITFLMVFIIQEAQNKDTLSIQLKLDELIAATKGASNRILNLEDLTEDQLDALKKSYEEIKKMAEKEAEHGSPHSVDELKKG